MSDVNEIEDVQEDIVTEDPNAVEDEQEVEQPEAEVGEQPENTGEEVTDGELVISVGDEEIPTEDEEVSKAPEWVRQLRKEHRELKRRNKELEAKLQATMQPDPVVSLPPKPKLEDFDYDPEKFEAKLEEWYTIKKKHDEQQEAMRRAQEEIQKAWQERLDAYNRAKSELKVRDYEDAESSVQEHFNVTQQGIIVQGLDNPALVVYALGKNPKKLAELASIKDPVRFAVAVAKLETQLKVSTRKPPPPPPKITSGGAPVSGSVDSTLERLRAEAERTGDYTKVIQYKRSKRQ